MAREGTLGHAKGVPAYLERGGAGDQERVHALLEHAVAGHRSVGMPCHEALARDLLNG